MLWDVLPSDARFQGIGQAKSRGRSLELLRQKTEYLYEMRDSVKEGKIKELMFGKIETNECQKWLNKEREIEDRVDNILRLHKERSDGLMISCLKLPHDNLTKTLEEITHHLEDCPLVRASKTHAPQREAAKTITSPNIGGKTHGNVEKIKNVNEKRKVDEKDESNVKFQVSYEHRPAPGEGTNVGFTDVPKFGSWSEPYTVTFGPKFEKAGNVNQKRNDRTKGASEVEKHAQKKRSVVKSIKMREGTSQSEFKSVVKAMTRGDQFGLEDYATSAASGDSEVLSETVPSAVTKSISTADEIESLESNSDGNERSEIHEIEMKTVPEEGQAKLKLSGNIKQSVEPAGPVTALISSPCNITAAETATAPPFRTEGGSVAANNPGAEVCYKTERDQCLLESGLDVKGSIQRTIMKVFRCMGDVTATKIGLCGISGIGKTSVLKALISHLETKSMFDFVLMVTISRYSSIRKIQNKFLKQLSLCQEDFETDFQVAEKLFQVFSGKKFLLILDDVWEQIDLKAVGIPDPRAENGSKILMASRKLDVCLDMDVIKVITVETVSGEEAWELFHEQVGRIIDLPHIQPFARTIVSGCGGLPLLLIVTGRALTVEYNVSVWEHASRQFSRASAAGMLHTENVIQLLKFSFDQLKDHVVKSCFLHCCLFSEDCEINISEFINYCILEGIITGSWANAYRMGQDIVDSLVRSSLMQVTEGGGSIKMHHLIRDLALGILSSPAEGCQFLLEAYSRLTEPSNPESSSSSMSLESPESYQFLLRAGAGLTEPPLEKEWKQAKMIFLMDNDLRTLPEKPNCPNLDTLFLQRNCQLRAIPLSFFNFMTSLKVLNLSKTRIKSLPDTLFKLENLQILILRDCERLVMLSSKVGSLQSLEVLDLGGTEIFKLPDEVGKLASLRHLEVSFYGSIDRDEYVKLPLGLISRGIISRLHALETLRVVVYPGDHRWYEDAKFVIVEVSNLTKLSSLCFHFPEVGLLELFLQSSIVWNAQHLTEFKFVVGHDVKSVTSRVPNHLVFDYHQQDRCLRFVNGEKIPDAVLTTLACSSALYLDHHLDIRSLTHFGVSNINGLKYCIISECPKIETVVDSEELNETVFPSLENLSIHHLWNLMCIWEGMLPKGSFAELRVLSVYACPRLKYVFRSSMIQFLSKLEQLVVEDCPAMEEIIHEGQIIDSDCIMLPSLKKLTLRYLPGLVNIWTSAWPSLEHISFYDCPKLKNLGVDSKLKDTIIEIKAEKTWWDTLEWEDDDLHLHLESFFSAVSENDL